MLMVVWSLGDSVLRVVVLKEVWGEGFDKKKDCIKLDEATWMSFEEKETWTNRSRRQTGKNRKFPDSSLNSIREL